LLGSTDEERDFSTLMASAHSRPNSGTAISWYDTTFKNSLISGLEHHDRKKLNEALGELRREGEQIENPESKEILSSLVENIEQNIDYSGSGEEHQDLVEEVKDAITHFEVEHPSITGILNEILMTLSNIGI